MYEGEGGAFKSFGVKIDGLKIRIFCFSCLPIEQNANIGDNCIQNFHLGRYIVYYTVGNLVLR